MSNIVQGFAPKTFRDAGTEQEFEGGKIHPVERGAYRNYAACGKMRAPTEAELAASGAADQGKPAGTGKGKAAA